jgi:hypothetical protein
LTCQQESSNLFLSYQGVLNKSPYVFFYYVRILVLQEVNCMSILKKITMTGAGICLTAMLFTGAAANAQGDAFSGGSATYGGGVGSYGTTGPMTGSQTTVGNTPGPSPVLQGATNGTIGPINGAETVVSGVNTAGTVRVNNLANLEALLNIIANGMEILGIAWGGPTMIMGFMHMAAGTQDAMKRVLFGAAGVTGGLATPGCINWLVASARDANLFS